MNVLTPNKITTTSSQKNGGKPGWRRVRFDQMAENIGDRVDNPAEAGVERYVGLEHLDPESLKIRRWGTPDEVEATKLRFQSGDIIFGKRRAYQRKLAVADFEGICSAHAMVLRAREETVVKDFLPVFMQSDVFFERALSISVGSLSPTINWKTLAAQEFVIPPMDEQRRIAEVLWAAEESIREWLCVVQELEVASRSIRENLVCSPSFPRKRLAECLESIIPGRSVLGINEPASESEYGVLKVSAVGEIGFVPSENKRLINSGDFRPEFVVRKNDFLITRCNTKELVGRACIVGNDHPRLMLCDKTIRLTFRAGLASQMFMLESLRSKESRNQIESIASGTGGAMKNISQDGIRGLFVPLPPYATQKRIESVIQENASALGSATAHIERVKDLKSSLVNQLISKNNV